MFTVETLAAQMPKSKRKNITQSAVDTINHITDTDDEAFVEAYRDNFVSFISVMRTGEYKIKDYTNAVKYVSYKLMEYDNIDAYMYTFPDRYARLLVTYAEHGTVEQIRNKKIASHVSMYNKNQLVNKILDQSTIPVSVLHVGTLHKAIMIQLDLAQNSGSDMVRTTAANSLLTHLRPKEVTKVELDIGIKETDIIGELRKATQELSAQQKLSIMSGTATAKEIAESIVIEAEVEDVTS